MPPTYLQTLAERDLVTEKAALLRLEREKAQYDRAAKRARTAQLLEDSWSSADPLHTGNTLASGLGSAANDLLSYSAIGRHSARPGSRQHGCLPPFYYTEMQHWMIVEAARTLEALCPTAACILAVLTQFAIFTGFTYTIVDKDPDYETPPKTRAQKWAKKWLEAVRKKASGQRTR